MKILHVIPYFYPAWSFGGPVRVAYHISKELARKGHQVTVFTTNVLDPKRNLKASNREYDFNHIRVRYFRNIARFSGLYISLNMIETLKKQIKNYDVVHMHEYRSFQNVITYYFARRHRRPFVLTAHGSIPRVVERFLLKKLFDDTFGCPILNDAFKVLASSSLEMKQYLEIGVPSEKIVIVPNGIDVKLFENLPEQGAFRKKFELDHDLPIILFAGRIHKRKGLTFLLDVFGSLNDTKAMLVIAGPDDGFMSKLREKAGRLKISEKVLFTGYVSERDKLAAYVDSEVVVYPGIYESFPLVPLEAALCSKPVIVSDDSVMAEIVRQGGFGMATRYGDIAQLKELLLTMLRDPKTAREMGRKGKEFVAKNYSWQGIVQKLEHVYSDAMQQARA